MSQHPSSPVGLLYMVRKLDFGGIERDVAKLSLGLDRSRFVPHVAVFEPGGLRWNEMQQARVPILNLNISSFASPNAVRSALEFRRFIRAHKIGIVHAYDSSAVFGVPLARLLRVPVVISSTVGSRELLDSRSKTHLRFTDRFVDGILVNCEAMRRHLVDDYAVAPERTMLCYNGVDTNEFYPAPTRRPDPVRDAPVVIGSVCVLRWEKRMQTLIEAFAAVSHVVPGSKVMIVGSGPELPRLEAKATELGVRERCVFIPATPVVAPLLRSIDIFVSCSVSEAFSNAILEAMACGCCPVGTRVGGTPELIADGQRGLLFETDNVGELSAKLELLLRDTEVRKQLSSNALHFAANDLSMPVALRRMSAIYDDLLHKKGAKH